MTHGDPRRLQAYLARTWGAFFGRFGGFTPIQRAAIPVLLDGHNTLLHAGTAGGKTEAALAPLIERHIPAFRPARRLLMLYILPTRALISDMAARLSAPLDRLHIHWAVRTRDLITFDPDHPVDILLTTPESLDSLLASTPKALIHLRAIVIDELHSFDAGVRGDHLRTLLRRLHHLREYALRQGDSDDAHIQYAGLSATLAEPEVSAARWFADAHVVSAPNTRTLDSDLIALDAAAPYALIDCLNRFRERGWKKALAFCNTRAEVEQFAALTREARTPFGGAVFVHYSNLDKERRVEIEDQFASAEAALCFSSSTLELGIDIGTIDATLLIGAPGSAEAFTQRVGRASRRGTSAQAVCFYRNALERALFRAHTAAALPYAPPTPFRLSVVVQQIFSLLKASPTGSVRLNPLARLFNGLVTPEQLTLMLGELQAGGYLREGRPGDWRAGDRLNRLVDLQSAERVALSLHSNLRISADMVEIRDRATQRVVAKIDRAMLHHDELLLEGRRHTIEWADGQALWVSPAASDEGGPKMIYRSSRPVLSYTLARAVIAVIGCEAQDAPIVATDEGLLWFHALGDVYGQALADLLAETVAVRSGPHGGLCVLLPADIDNLPIWTPERVRRYVIDHYRAYERLLDLGAYHEMLPVELRRQAVIDQFDVHRFLDSVRVLRVVAADEAQAAALIDLC